MIANRFDRYVIGRDRNVVRVDFARQSEPPTPPFPGGAAMRAGGWRFQPDDAAATALRGEAA